MTGPGWRRAVSAEALAADRSGEPSLRDWGLIFAARMSDDAFREAFHEAEREYDDAHCPCGTTRWVDDENWSPEYYEIGRKVQRVPGAGRIPCGFCNHGGWDVPDPAVTA